MADRRRSVSDVAAVTSWAVEESMASPAQVVHLGSRQTTPTRVASNVVGDDETGDAFSGLLWKPLRGLVVSCVLLTAFVCHVRYIADDADGGMEAPAWVMSWAFVAGIIVYSVEMLTMVPLAGRSSAVLPGCCASYIRKGRVILPQDPDDLAAVQGGHENDATVPNGARDADWKIDSGDMAPPTPSAPPDDDAVAVPLTTVGISASMDTGMEQTQQRGQQKQQPPASRQTIYRQSTGVYTTPGKNNSLEIDLVTLPTTVVGPSVVRGVVEVITCWLLLLDILVVLLLIIVSLSEKHNENLTSLVGQLVLMMVSIPILHAAQEGSVWWHGPARPVECAAMSSGLCGSWQWYDNDDSEAQPRAKPAPVAQEEAEEKGPSGRAEATPTTTNKRVTGLNMARGTDSSFKLLQYNIQTGVGMDGVYDLQRTADVIYSSGADVVTIQEISRYMRCDCYGRKLPDAQQALRTDDQIAILSRLTGFHVTFGVKTRQFGGEYGNAILSRFPILEEESRLLRSYTRHGSDALYGPLPQVAVAVRVRPPDLSRDVWVICVHLGCDASGQEQAFEMEEVILFSRELCGRCVKVGSHAPQPYVIIGGDFNTLPGTAALEVARMHGFLDVIDQQKKRQGLRALFAWDPPSFPSSTPLIRLDYVLTSPKTAESLLCCTSASESGSDRASSSASSASGTRHLAVVKAGVIHTTVSDHIPLAVHLQEEYTGYR